MKGTFSAAFIFALLIAAIAGAFFIRVGLANPALLWENWGLVSPRSDTVPPQVSIFSPKNNTFYYNRTVELIFNVSKPTGPYISYTLLLEINYEASWINQRVYLLSTYEGNASDKFSGSLVLTAVPDGKQSIKINVKYSVYYRYPEQRAFARSYILGSSTVMFTVDTTPPRVSVALPQNKTYDVTDVPLDFTVNEQTSRLAYSLDGQENVTISGNTVLSGLSSGEHTVTVYAWDEAENVGASGTVYFTVAEPFPTTVVAVASIALAAVIVVRLLFFFKTKEIAP